MHTLIELKLKTLLIKPCSSDPNSILNVADLNLFFRFQISQLVKLLQENKVDKYILTSWQKAILMMGLSVSYKTDLCKMFRVTKGRLAFSFKR